MDIARHPVHGIEEPPHHFLCLWAGNQDLTGAAHSQPSKFRPTHHALHRFSGQHPTQMLLQPRQFPLVVPSVQCIEHETRSIVEVRHQAVCNGRTAGPPALAPCPPQPVRDQVRTERSDCPLAARHQPSRLRDVARNQLRRRRIRGQWDVDTSHILNSMLMSGSWGCLPMGSRKKMTPAT